MPAISPTAPLSPASIALMRPAAPQPAPGELELKETFQDFVAGTFYKQMLASLRKTHGKPAYFHGGRAEEVFQGQLDQQVGEELASRQGAALSDDLYRAFVHNRRP